jgi:short-subunit dehydrogenase
MTMTLQRDSQSRDDARGIRESVLITGATSGIGRAFALALAERREPLVLLGRHEPTLHELAEEIRARHGQMPQIVAVDLSDPQAPLIVLRHLWKNRLRIFTLINCAGVGRRVDFARQSWDSIRETIDVNVIAVVRLTRLFLPHMIRWRRGAIINIASMAAFEPSPSFTVYAGTKSFLQNFTESLADELTGTGVRAVLVCPGVTRTRFQETAGIRPEEIPANAQTPDQVVRETLAAIDQQNRLIVPGFSNRIRVWAQRASLRSVLKGARKCLRRMRMVT